MPNRLAQETSPYLLQHANNPVDWYPWSEEALQRAAAEDKPIFLSIGYSACHWCHVMEHESFEDPHMAELLNQSFVCIKVDREERPDLDQIYMQAVQLLTGRGGWPMSVFLTPERQPFYGGTYWPPQRRHGMPGFDEVLRAVLDAWEKRREQAVAQGAELTGRIQAGLDVTGEDQLELADLQAAGQRIQNQWDSRFGGFGQAPKFPHSMAEQFLLRLWKRDPEQHAGYLQTVQHNLDQMSRGGIHDHLAGGFARYSVDERWLVPHFEKMLYDNALLLDVYLDLVSITGDDKHKQVASDICQYLTTYLRDEQGAFHSTEDADSEGEEGKFYVWTWEEIQELLGPDLGEKFAYVYDVTPEGNFEGKSILNLPRSLAECAELRGWNERELARELKSARAQLLRERDKRVRPGKDDKVLTSWNGLAIGALARAGAILDEPRWLEAAVGAAEFMCDTMRDVEGRLLHTYRHGQARLAGYLDDYANLAQGFTTLYEMTFDDRWLDRAMELAEIMLTHFADPSGQGFYYTADDHEALIARMKDVQDSSQPSGNAMAATVLCRLGQWTLRQDLLDAAWGVIQMSLPMIRQYPLAVGQMLIAADMLCGPMQQAVLLEDESSAFAQQARQRYRPRSVLAGPSGSPHLQALVAGKDPADQPTLYLCESGSCRAPNRGRTEVAAAIDSL